MGMQRGLQPQSRPPGQNLDFCGEAICPVPLLNVPTLPKGVYRPGLLPYLRYLEYLTYLPT